MSVLSDRIGSKKTNFFLMTSLLFVAIAVILSSYPATAQIGSGSNITFKEFVDDYNINTNSYDNLAIDEEVIIEDKIVYIRYNESSDLTHFWFESVGQSHKRPHLEVISDLTGSYHVGDQIEIKITIISVQGFPGYEDYDLTPDDISIILKVEEEAEAEGIVILGKHFDLPEELDNDIGRFLLLMLFWLVIAIITLFVLDPIIRSAVKKSKTELDDIILAIIRKPVLILIILYGLVNSLEALHLPDEIMSIFYTIYGVGFIAMMTWIALKIYKGVLIELGRNLAKNAKSQLEHILIPVLEKIGTIIISIFGILVILGYFGIDLTVLALGGVVISMVIAFAAQDTLSNFFGGIFLIVEPNFKEGDIVKVKDDYYEVKTIGMRTTRLYDIFKHIIVVVPNNTLANEMLINITEPDRRIKEKVLVGVAYGVDTMKVEKILLEIGNAHKDIITDDPDRKPFVRFHSFGDSSLDFGLYFWVRDLDNRYRVKHELNHTIHKRFEEENIEIPFPQRVVTMKKEA